MALDQEDRERIASDLAGITKIQALDVLEGRKSDAFDSLYQQACSVKRTAERRLHLIADDLKGMDGLDAFDGEWHCEQIQFWINELFMFISGQGGE